MSSKKPKNNHGKTEERVEELLDDDHYIDEYGNIEEKVNIHEENMRRFDEESERIDYVLQEIKNIIYEEAACIGSGLTFCDIYDFVYG